MSDQDLRSRLEHSPMFADVDREAIGDLAAVFEVRRVGPGEAVIREGDEGDSMYVISRGRVRVEKRTPYQDSFTVTFLDGEAGAFFGELALLDRDQRSATVVAETDAELLVISRDRFLEFGNRHPASGLAITRRIARNLAERLRRANADLVTLFSALVHEIEEDF